MRKITFISVLLLVVTSCSKERTVSSLDPNTIQIDGANWDVERSCVLFRRAGTPAWYNIMIKIEGTDGTALFISLPEKWDNGMNAAPGIYPVENQDIASLRVSATYYLSDAMNGAAFKTGDPEGYVEIISVDPANQTINVKFDLSLYDKNGAKMNIRSGEMQQIGYQNKAAYSTFLSLSALRNDEAFQISEYGSDMVEGRTDWLMYENTHYYSLRFSIPWSAKPGVHVLSPSDSSVVQYAEGVGYLLESATYNIEFIDFCDAKIRGTFHAIFRHPTDPAVTVEFKDGLFETNYDF